jgi:hypothetical protein
MRSSPGTAGKPVSWTDIPAEARVEIERLLPEGNYIEAVKVFRRHSQSSLKDARDAVFETARGMGLEPPKAMTSWLSCLLVALGFLVWVGFVAAMPFLAGAVLPVVFEDRISPRLVEAIQALLPIAVVIASVFVVIAIAVRRSGRNRTGRDHPGEDRQY